MIFEPARWPHRELISRAGFEQGEDLDLNFNLAIGPDTYWAFFRYKPGTQA